MNRWYEQVRDPNSPEALRLRASRLRRARRDPVRDRVGFLTELARGRRVLDVGCVDHDATSSTRANWLHRHLASVASHCVGIDVLPEAVAALRDQGYDVRLCDITVEPLDETFDLVVAGEVLEHVGGAEALLEHAVPMLAPGGRLVLSTPNPFALHRVWRGCRGDARDSVDHVAYFSPSNIAELAERVGLELDAYRGVRLKAMRSLRGRVQAASRALLSGTVFTEEIGCETIIYECVLAP